MGGLLFERCNECDPAGHAAHLYDGVNDEIADIALLERDSGYTFKYLYNP